MRLIYPGFHSISILVMLRIPACLCYDLVPFDRFGPQHSALSCTRVRACRFPLVLFTVRVRPLFEDTYSGG